jgi:hypothetical protein
LARENPASGSATISFGLRRVGFDLDAMEGAVMLILMLSFATLIAAGGFSFPYCLRKRQRAARAFPCLGSKGRERAKWLFQ